MRPDCIAQLLFMDVMLLIHNYVKLKFIGVFLCLADRASQFISVINQLDAQNFCFTISLFHASTCLEHMCSKHVEA